MTSLTFNNTELTVIDQNGQQWVTSSQLCKALGYSAHNAVSSLYAAHKDEFDDSMTLVVKTTTRGQIVRSRIFSRRGAHLIAVFSKTSKAKEFRRWVLDVLEEKSTQQQKPSQEDKEIYGFVSHSYACQIKARILSLTLQEQLEEMGYHPLHSELGFLAQQLRYAEDAARESLRRFLGRTAPKLIQQAENSPVLTY